jgi:hypothetical protein
MPHLSHAEFSEYSISIGLKIYEFESFTGYASGVVDDQLSILNCRQKNRLVAVVSDPRSELVFADRRALNERIISLEDRLSCRVTRAGSIRPVQRRHSV